MGEGADKSDATYSDFIRLLLKNRRIDVLREIAHAFIALYREYNHIFSVEVVSAAPLAPEALARIKSIVEQHLGGGTLEFSSRVDSALIGGFVVNVNSERLDASVRNELKQLRLNLIR